MPRAVGNKKICGSKECPHGGKFQPTANFNKNRLTADGFQCACRDCARAQVKKSENVNIKKTRERKRKWKIDNPDKVKADAWMRHLKREYNLTPAQYDLMMRQQDNKCGLCGVEFTYNGATNDLHYPNVHHDHETGFVIGIWCRGCNTGEAYIKTVPQAIALAKYIQEREAITLLKAA